jgi:hypothetical protein
VECDFDSITKLNINFIVDNQDQEETVPDSPVSTGPENENKHRDDATDIPSKVVEKKATEEFEEHNMTDHRGCNEMVTDVPVKKKNRSPDSKDEKSSK